MKDIQHYVMHVYYTSLYIYEYYKQRDDLHIYKYIYEGYTTLCLYIISVYKSVEHYIGKRKVLLYI